MRILKEFLLLILVCSFTITSSHVCARQNDQKDSLNMIVNEYYSLNINVFQEGSKIEDIDRIFSLFTSDFTYIHPKYGGTYTREDLYQGYVRNQNNGGYNGEVVDVRIINKIVGLNAVVVEKRFVKKAENGTEESESQMTLFEFVDGKISKIFEYW